MFVMDFLVDMLLFVWEYWLILGVVEKWDLYICGFELVIGYFEFVDFVIQCECFVEQVKFVVCGDVEVMLVDDEFFCVFEYGMLLFGGMGMGIDWLLMVIMGLGIWEMIFFFFVKQCWFVFCYCCCFCWNIYFGSMVLLIRVFRSIVSEQFGLIFCVILRQCFV